MRDAILRNMPEDIKQRTDALKLIGTWVSVPYNQVSHQEWMNLHANDNHKHEFRLQVRAGIEPISFEFEEVRDSQG